LTKKKVSGVPPQADQVSGFRIDIRAIQIYADIESVKIYRFPLFSSIR